MRVAGAQPGWSLLPARGCERREPAVDAAAGRAIHEDAVLWEPEDDRVAANQRLRGESQAGFAAADKDGNRGHVPETETQPAEGGAQDLSLPAGGDQSEPRQSGVEHGHHL